MTKPSKTALFAAAKTWNARAIRELLADAPGLIAVRDPRSRQALHLACSVKPGTPGTQELKRGANVDNCLFAAAWNDNGTMLRGLLKSARTIDESQEGAPVLIAANRWRKLEALKVLMSAGADVSRQDAKGHDALFHARARKLPATVIARLAALRRR